MLLGLALASSKPLIEPARSQESPLPEIFENLMDDRQPREDHLHELQPLPWKHIDPFPFTPPPIALTLPPYRGCYYDGKWYHSGTEMSRGYDASSNWCWFVLCEDGHIIHGDDFHCRKTNPPPPPPPPPPPGVFIAPTTRPPVTPKPTEPLSKYDYKCEDNGKEYKYGQEIYHHQDGDFCYGEYCGEWGELIPWENWDCDSKAESSAILHKGMAGCYVHGKHYSPGEDIEKGRDGIWCYGKYCSEKSEVIHYHKEHCNRD